MGIFEGTLEALETRAEALDMPSQEMTAFLCTDTLSLDWYDRSFRDLNKALAQALAINLTSINMTRLVRDRGIGLLVEPCIGHEGSICYNSPF